ncbi:MAG: hypothetical protein EXR36_11135 [Betaproteobacteria bacterium]|nr:hypothetical protein [Betaproteobacteria bacterium]
MTGADIFALQDDITSNAVASITVPHGQIGRAGLQEAKGKAPDSIESYDCVLRATAYINVFTSELHGAVRDCLERTVARDPSYAEAWSWLGRVYVHEYEFDFNPRRELYDARDRALEAGLRAAELDPSSAVAHMTLAWIRLFRRELDASLASAERAVALNPNDLEVVCLSGLATAYVGKWERGIALTKKAMALSPNYPRWCHFTATIYHYFRGEYEQSLAETVQIEMTDFFWTQTFLAANYAQLGRME